MKPTGPAAATVAKVEWAAAIVITLIVGWLQFILARNLGGFWVDEVNSVAVAQAPSLARFWSLLPFDSFPVPFYLLLRGWMAALGNDELRLLGLVVGLAIVGALWLNARAMGRALPLISLALFGMNAPSLRCGAMMRGYGVGTVFMLLTLMLVWRLACSGSRRAAAVAALCAVGAVQTLYQNAGFVFAICLGGMAVTVRGRLWRRTALVFAVGVPAALSLLPYIPLMMKERQVLVPWQAFNPGQAVTATVETLRSSGRMMPVVWGVLLLLGFGLAILAQFPRVFNLAPGRRDLALYHTVAFGMGFIGFWTFFKALGLEMAARYYISILALAAVFLEGVVAALPEAAWRRWLVIGVSAGIVGASFPSAWKSSHSRSTNIDQIADRIGAAATKGDFIVVLPWFHGATFQYYFKGVTAWSTLPELDDYQVSREDLLRLRLATPNAATPVLERVGRTLQSGHRLWIVGEPGAVPAGLKPPTLPPAPFGPRGWYPVPYERVWAMELGYLLQHHAAQCALLMTPPRDVIGEEHVPLAVFEGWH